MQAVVRFPLDISVGESIDFNGKRIICRERTGCRKCFFDKHPFCNYVACFPDERKDGDDVHFEYMKGGKKCEK